MTPQKAHRAAHQENGLYYVPRGVENNQSAGDPQSGSFEPKDEQETKHHKIDAAWWLDDWEIFPCCVVDEEFVDFSGPDEGVIPEAFSLMKVLCLIILDYC